MPSKSPNSTLFRPVVRFALSFKHNTPGKRRYVFGYLNRVEGSSMWPETHNCVCTLVLVAETTAKALLKENTLYYTLRATSPTNRASPGVIVVQQFEAEPAEGVECHSKSIYVCPYSLFGQKCHPNHQYSILFRPVVRFALSFKHNTTEERLYIFGYLNRVEGSSMWPETHNCMCTLVVGAKTTAKSLL